MNDPHVGRLAQKSLPAAEGWKPTSRSPRWIGFNLESTCMTILLGIAFVRPRSLRRSCHRLERESDRGEQSSRPRGGDQRNSAPWRGCWSPACHTRLCRSCGGCWWRQGAGGCGSSGLATHSVVQICRGISDKAATSRCGERTKTTPSIHVQPFPRIQIVLLMPLATL